MPPSFEYSSTPFADSLQNLYKQGCTDRGITNLHNQFVYVKDKTYSIAQLVTIAEAYNHLINAPAQNQFLANMAFVNYKHFNPCFNIDADKEMASTAEIQGIEKNSPEWILLYIIRDFFKRLMASTAFAEQHGEIFKTLADAIAAGDNYDDETLKSFEDGTGVLLSVEEAKKIMALLTHYSQSPTP